MTHRLSRRSLNNLRGVHPDLVAVVKRAIEITAVDFVVIDGVRSRAEQAANVAKGVSWTMRSNHLPQADGYGHAVDLAAYVNGGIVWGPWKHYAAIAKAMRAAAREIGVDIVWGGDWKQRDGVHFELRKAAA